MSWIAIVAIVIFAWLALKAVGVFFKLALWLLVALAVWWFAAPYLGLPVNPF
jgi:hypothetical protein